MQRILLIVFTVLVLSFSATAQISIQSFSVLPTDQTARITDPVIDQNGEKCALIKVVSDQTGFAWEGGMLGIVKVEKKIGEYWVYLPHGAKKLTIKHDHLGVLRNYVYPEAIREATVYEMVLTTAKVSTIVEKIVIPTQWFMLTSKPEGANVYINDQNKGLTPFQMEMEEGHYTYRIEMPLYHPEAGAFDFTQAEGKKLIQTDLKPNFGYANIITRPENGATVYVDGQIQSQTTPLKTGRLKSGTHSVRVEKNMFHTKSLEIVIQDDQIVQTEIVLDPAFGAFQINTEPEQGAAVFIDGNPTGKTTPCTLEKLGSGEHLIRVQKEWFQPKAERVDLTDGENKPLNMLMEPIFGTVNISAAEGAIIYIDNERKNTSHWTGRLIAGWHTFEARKEKFHTASQKIEVRLGQEQNLDLQPMPMHGTLKVVSTPWEAKILIDGKNYGTSPNSIPDLLVGTYTVEISKEGFTTVSKTLTIEENKTESLNVELREDQLLSFNSQPADARLFLNGVYKGQTPCEIHVEPGSYNVELNKEGYNSYQKQHRLPSPTGELVIPLVADFSVYVVKPDDTIYSIARRYACNVAELVKLNGNKPFKVGDGIKIPNAKKTKLRTTANKAPSKSKDAKNRTVRGKVTSAEDGSEIPGASIIVEGTSIGTCSDINGNYSLTVPKGKAVLLFKFVGCMTKVVEFSDCTTINVALVSTKSKKKKRRRK
jgi:LysM repeat protein